MNKFLPREVVHKNNIITYLVLQVKKKSETNQTVTSSMATKNQPVANQVCNNVSLMLKMKPKAWEKKMVMTVAICPMKQL